MQTPRLIEQAPTPFGEALVYIGRHPVGDAIAVQLVGTDTGESQGVFSTNLVS